MGQSSQLKDRWMILWGVEFVNNTDCFKKQTFLDTSNIVYSVGLSPYF